MKKKQYLMSMKMADALGVSSRTFLRFITRHNITPDAFAKCHTHNISLWLPERVEQLRVLMGRSNAPSAEVHP